MKKLFTIKSLVLLSLSTLFVMGGCKDEGGGYKPNISGSTGEMLIVMNDAIKDSVGGETLEAIMRQEVLALPQAESLFDVSIIPHRAFGERLRPFRNLILVDVGKEQEPDVKFYKNRWGKQHAMAHITAQNKWQLDSIVKAEEIRLTGFFVRAERDRSLNYFNKYSHRDMMDKFKDKWDAYMVIPSSFDENKPGKEFMWLSQETPLVSQGVFIYSFEYSDFDSFSEANLLNKRDSVLKINVPGPSLGSYMTTESRLPVTYKRFERNDHQVVEMRGLWRVEGDVMGGPFVSLAHIDPENARVVVTEGYVYAPEKPEKRNLIWQIEAVLYSFKFLENDETTEDTE
jgi:hypothetical protein